MKKTLEIGTIVQTLLAAFVIGGIVLYGMMQVNTNNIASLQRNQMSREVIETKLNHIINNTATLHSKIDVVAVKLDKHIKETK